MTTSPVMTPSTRPRLRSRGARGTEQGAGFDDFAWARLPIGTRRQQLGSLLVLGQVLLVVACLVPVGPIWSAVVAPVAGWLLIAVAVVIGGLSALGLGRDLRLHPIPSAAARLHRNGIYAFVRHPMHLAVVLGAVGVTMVTGRWLAVLGTLGLLVVLTLTARLEDVVLQRRFGWEFAVYAARVPAIIPRPRRSPMS